MYYLVRNWFQNELKFLEWVKTELNEMYKIPQWKYHQVIASFERGLANCYALSQEFELKNQIVVKMKKDWCQKKGINLFPLTERNRQEICHDYLNGMSTKQIKEKYHRSNTTIYQILEAAGIPRGKQGRSTVV
jgi:hypothetical protein